jgi:hypothetical protein
LQLHRDHGRGGGSGEGAEIDSHGVCLARSG